jgi:queuine tRNA-ribosyltransferase
MPFSFSILHRDPASRARTGRASTSHGTFDTPAFMPVGTRGSLKGVSPDQARDTGAQIILGNTYHLLLRPGAPTVASLGGLQKFSAWNGPMLTDSGGFQIFSLAQLAAFDERDGGGVTFKSHIDGSPIRLAPESAMRVQHLLGADIIMALDDCPPADCPPERLAEALDRTHRWAEMCLLVHEQLTRDRFGPPGAPHDQALFGIVQGGTSLEARAASATFLRSLNLPGYALGGLAVGEGFDRMVDTINHTAPLLPDDKPRYLMGVGFPKDILAAVKAGIDMFDCVLPTRNGRNALAFTADGTRRIRNARYAQDPRPLEDNCDCYACRNFSRGYLRHLFSVKEMLGPTLISIHNLRFFQRFMDTLRTAIRNGTLATLTAPPDTLATDEAEDTVQ